MPRKKKPVRKLGPDRTPGGHAWARLRQSEDARGLSNEGLVMPGESDVADEPEAASMDSAKADAGSASAATGDDVSKAALDRRKKVDSAEASKKKQEDKKKPKGD